MFQKSIGERILEVSHKLIERPNKSVYFNHIHNHCELLLFISGKADFNIDGQIFSPKPYDLIFVPAATYHYITPTESVPYENYVIGIDPSIIPAEHYKKLFSSPLLISIRDDRELLSFFLRLDTYHDKYTKEDFETSAAALITELVTYCSYRKNELDSGHGGSLTHIGEIIKWINMNIEQPIDADAISKQLMFSKSYIQNIFSKNMHIGLKKYIMQKKIYAAHADITRGMSPYAVCEKYCFGDYSVFYRLYKKTFGQAPTASPKRG